MKERRGEQTAAGGPLVMNTPAAPAEASIPNGRAAVPGAQKRGRSRTASLTKWLLPFVATLAVIVAVELIIRGGLVLKTAFPTPTAVFEAMIDDFQTQSYWTAVWETLKGWALGLGLAIAVAVPLGIVVGTSNAAYRSVRLVIDFLRPIPSIALLPLLILVFGISQDLKVFMAAVGAFFPLFFQTMYGVQDVDPVARDTAAAYRLNRFMRFVFVDLPGATPYIATGLRLSAAISLVVCVATELIVGVPGLGAGIFKAQYGGRLAEMYSLIVTTGLLGLLIAIGFNRLERITLRWHPSQRADRPV
jgi:ABC-type nitrate/sulfonate/bicarbonate transport system permease component